jgi:hypothetical protein
MVRISPVGLAILNTHLPAWEKHLRKIPDHDNAVSIVNDGIVINGPVPIPFIYQVFLLELLLQLCVLTGLL